MQIVHIFLADESLRIVYIIIYVSLQIKLNIFIIVTVQNRTKNSNRKLMLALKKLTNIFEI